MATFPIPFEQAGDYTNIAYLKRVPFCMGVAVILWCVQRVFVLIGDS